MKTVGRVLNNFPSILVGILIGLSCNAFIAIAWTGPTASAPSGNISAPLNVGTTAQVKNGNVGVNTFTAFGDIRLAGGWAPSPSTITYLNFSNIQYPSSPVWGSSGYGIRDNNGTLEFKNSGGSWANINSIVQSYLSLGSVTQIRFSDATTQTTAGITSESDPQVSTINALELCRGNSGGTAAVCDLTACGSHAHGEVWITNNWPDPACGGITAAIYQCRNGTTATIESKTSARCSCFTKDALVMMADGTTKEIHQVKVGDRVVGKNGINTVIGIDHTLLWKGKPQYLISINAGKAVMTDNHPVMTTDGWKAVNPMLAEREAYDILSGKVSQLAMGDEIVTAAGNLRVESITLEPQADTPTRLYNLYLDGDHTFYSNGMLVHGVVPDKEGRFTLDYQHNGEEE